MSTQEKKVSFRHDLLTTTLVSALTVLCLLGTVRILAQALTPKDFGAYALFRRLIATAEPFFVAAIGLALTRYVSRAKKISEKQSYLVAAAGLVSVISLVLFVLSYLNRQALAIFFFHDEAYEPLFIQSVVYMMAYSFFVLFYAYNRGLGKVRKSNAWQLVGIACGPLLIAYFFGRQWGVDHIVLATAFILGLSFIPVYMEGIRFIIKSSSEKEIIHSFKEITRYAFPRIPGGAAYGLMMAVGPYLATRYGAIEGAGYLVVSQMVLRAAEGFMDPAQRTLFPRLSALAAEKESPKLLASIQDLLSFIVHAGTYAMIHALIWSRFFLIFWLGDKYSAALPALQIALCAFLPYMGFVVLRPVIDAVEVRPVTTYAAFIGLAATAIFAGLFLKIKFSIPLLALANAIGFGFIGIYAFWYFFSHYKINKGAFHFLYFIALNTVLGVLSWTLSRLPFFQDLNLQRFVIIGLIEAALLASYLFFLYKAKVAWVGRIKHSFIA